MKNLRRKKRKKEFVVVCYVVTALKKVQSTSPPSCARIPRYIREVSPRPTSSRGQTAVPYAVQTPHCNLGHGNCANTPFDYRLLVFPSYDQKNQRLISKGKQVFSLNMKTNVFERTRNDELSITKSSIRKK